MRDRQGRLLPERHIGTLYVRGSSVMGGYFDNEKATRDVLPEDGWLNTGDLAYVADKNIFITGRKKDFLNMNGRNVWPQGLESDKASDSTAVWNRLSHRTGAAPYVTPDDVRQARAGQSPPEGRLLSG